MRRGRAFRGRRGARGASRDVDDREGGDEGGGDGGDAVAAAARDANARGAVTCSIERASDEEGGEEFVCVSVRGAFAVRWRRDDPGDASTTTATAEEDGTRRRTRR